MSDENDSWLEGIGVDVMNIVGKVEEATNSVIDSAVSTASSAYDSAESAASSAYASVTSTASSAYDAASGAASSVYNQASSAASSAWDTASNAASEVADAAGNAYDGASNWASDIYDDASNTASSVYDDAANTASSVYDDASNAASNAWDEASDVASDVWNKASEAASDVADAAEEAYDDAGNAISDVYNQVSDAASEAYDDASNAASSAWDEVSEVASEAWDKASEVATEVAQAAEEAWDWGASVVDDILDDVNSVFDDPNALLAATGAEGAVDGHKDDIEGKFHAEIPETKLKDFNVSKYFKGSLKLKGEVTGEVIEVGANNKVKVTGTANKGMKVEVELAKQKSVELAQGFYFKDPKESLSFEMSGKKVDISASFQVNLAHHDFPWITGFVKLKFAVVGAEWEKLAKNPDDFTLVGVEILGGAEGAGSFGVAQGYEAKIKAQWGISGAIKPNWAQIFAEGAKEVAKKGGQKVAEEVAKRATQLAAESAAEVIVMDSAALASAAAVVVLPLATAAAIGYGMYQEAKNMQANQKAIQSGLASRQQAKLVAEGYARTITGGRSGGDLGSQNAERDIARIMSETGATREQVCEAVKAEQGGYSAIRGRELKRLKDKMYADTVQIFDDSHKDEFGVIEDMGPDWGFRGSFRSMLRMILYADD